MADLEQRPLLLLLLVRLESMVMMFSKKNLLKRSLRVLRLLLFLVLLLGLGFIITFIQGFWMMMNLLLRCHRNIEMNLIVRIL